MFPSVVLSCYVIFFATSSQVFGQAGHPDFATVDTDESELQESGPLGIGVQRSRFNLNTAENECALFYALYDTLCVSREECIVHSIYIYTYITHKCNHCVMTGFDTQDDSRFGSAKRTNSSGKCSSAPLVTGSAWRPRPSHREARDVYLTRSQ